MPSGTRTVSLGATFIISPIDVYKRQELQSSNKLRNIEQEISYKRYQDKKHATEMQEQIYEIELLKRNLWPVSYTHLASWLT